MPLIELECSHETAVTEEAKKVPQWFLLAMTVLAAVAVPPHPMMIVKAQSSQKRQELPPMAKQMTSTPLAGTWHPMPTAWAV